MIEKYTIEVAFDKYRTNDGLPTCVLTRNKLCRFYSCNHAFLFGKDKHFCLMLSEDRALENDIIDETNSLIEEKDGRIIPHKNCPFWAREIEIQKQLNRTCSDPNQIMISAPHFCMEDISKDMPTKND